MRFYAFKIDFETKDKFKETAKSIGLKSRYDYREKRWEMYGKKISKTKEKKIIDTFGEAHIWDAKKDIYSQNVYTPKNKR